MNFKSPQPLQGNSPEESISNLLGYIESLKAETEARITMIDNTIERIKAKLDSIVEVTT